MFEILKKVGFMVIILTLIAFVYWSSWEVWIWYNNINNTI